MTSHYLDSSAIVKLVIDEQGSAELRATIVDASLVTSRIAVVEVCKAIARVDPAVPVEVETSVDLGPASGLRKVGMM